MKNIIKVIIPLAVFLILLIVCIFSFNNENNVYHGIYDSNKNYFETDTTIAIMYETDNGNYEVSDETSWLLDGYRFNETLSGCENGGTISWNDATQKVEMKTNISDKCYIYFDKYLSVQITNVTASNITSNSITVNVSATSGTNAIQTYYYSINNGAYTSSSSNTYTFNGLSAGQNYSIRVYVKDTNGVDSNVYTINAETESVTYICNTGTNLATCIKNQYTSQGANGIYYHTSSLANSAADNSYRYSGANPNNYVCFGSDAASCPSANLYRIIGVFGSEVKLIKSTSYGSYAWDSGNSNTWDSSTKPDIRTTLNSTYRNSLSATWQNKIATHTWKVGGMANSQTNTAKQYYNVEVGSSSSSTPDSMKIGLMYVSDYGFAASNSHWTTELYNYESATSDNWLYLGSNEWTISRISGGPTHAFRVRSSGFVDGISLVNRPNAVRPVFYLTSSTTYVSGSGSSADPIRIN